MAFNASYNNYPPQSGANYTNYVPNYTAMTLPLMNPDAMMKMFHEYKESCRIRINSCGDDDRLKVASLESMVTELLEQNELLLNSLIEINQSNQSKDSLITSSSSFSSSFSASSAASFDSGYGNNVNYNNCGQINPYNQLSSGQCPVSANGHVQNPSAHVPAAKNQQKMQNSSKISTKDECNQTNESITDFRSNNQLKINYEQIKNEHIALMAENETLKETNSRLIKTSEELNEENSDLRHENDNLRHDMSNLVQIINQRGGDNQGNNLDNCAKDNANAHLTFL